MTMNWKNNRLPFPEHNAIMKSFRKQHGNVNLLNLPRHDEPGFLKGTRPLTIDRISVGNGGSRIPVPDMNWATFIMVPKVASYKISSN